jgi:hypothetical protein
VHQERVSADEQGPSELLVFSVIFLTIAILNFKKKVA